MDHGGGSNMNHGGNTPMPMAGDHNGMMGNMTGNGTTMNPNMPGMHGMSMYFTTDWEGKYILFQQWMLMKPVHLIVACICIGIVAALYEGLKVLREYLLLRYGAASYQVQSEASDDGKGDVILAQPGTVRTRMCTWLHFLQTFLHLVQVTISYMLMLIVMTFNVWLGLSVVLGAGLGYFIFGWKRAVIVDSNEHCH